MSSRFERLKGKIRSSSPATSSAVSSTTSSSAVNAVTDLWDQAYLDLKNDSKTKRLIEAYEKIILGDAKKDGISASDLQAYYDAELSSKREQMSRVLRRKSQEVEAAKLTIKLGPEKEVDVAEQFDRVINCVIWAKDFVATAVKSDPHASLAWAGVCLILPLLLNPTKQRNAAVKAMDLATNTICRSKVIDEIYEISSAQGLELQKLKRAFEKKRIKLYAKILELEARIVCQYSDKKITRIGNDMIQRNDWQTLVEEIEILDTLSDEDRRILDAVRLSSGFREMQVNFDQVRTRMARLELQNEVHHDYQIEWRKSEEQRENNKKLSEILTWISSVPYEENHVFNRGKRLDGTREWLFAVEHQPEFAEWRSSNQSSILWLLGGIGVGKTTLVSKVIDLFLAPPKSVSCFVYFYCERGGVEKNMPVDIIRSILRQLCLDSTHPYILKPVKDFYDARKKDHFAKGKLNIAECTELIIAISAIVPSITIIIDAVDECDPAGRWELLEFLSNISSKAANPIKIFLSSRTDEHLQNVLAGSKNLYLDIENNRLDIESFVNEKVHRLSLVRLPSLIGGPVSAGLKGKIIRTLIAEAHGMFRWVELQLELICDGERVKRERDIEDVLGELPKTLAASYAQILERIEKLPPSSLRITKNSLAWILCAKRQLTIVELLAAASMDAGGHRDQIQESDLLHYCFNMILADHNTDCFRVAHPSVRDFLVLCPQFMDRPINSMATERCMGTFLFSADMDAQEPEKDDPFFVYSTTFLSAHLEEIWTEEMEDVPENPIFQEFFASTGHALTSPAFDLWIKTIARLAHLERKEHVELLSLVEEHTHTEPSQDLRLGKRSIIFVSSHFGLLSLLSRALRGESEPLRRNCNDQTAFSLACQRENINTAKLILSQTSQTSLTADGLKKINFDHPFHNQSWFQNPRIKKWVVDLTTKSQWSESEGTLGNPLRIILDHEMGPAVARNRLKTVKWLLDEGASVNAFWRRPYEGSVLQHAVEHGNIKMVEMLVNAGADILFPTLNWRFRNPVDAAASEGNKAAISILLGGQPIEILDQALIEIAHFFGYRRIKPDTPNPYLPALKIALSMSPSQAGLDEALILAARSGSEVEIELLIHKGANAHYKSDSMDSALRAAVMGNNQRAIKLLVGKFHCAVDEDHTNKDNATLLEEAIDVGEPELFELLFELGAIVSSRLLEKALFADKLLYREIDDPYNGWFVRYLVEKHPEYSNRAKTDPDWLAGLLLQTLNHSNDRGSNVTGASSPAVVESLLGMGADVNYSSSSPIRIAIEKYDEDMCGLLLRHGANIYGLGANFLHTVAHRPEDVRMSGGVTNNLRGKSRRRFATADLMELLLSRGLDPWGSSPEGIPIQIAIRECGPNWRESGKSGHDNKFSVLRHWFLEPRRNLDVDFADDRTLHYVDHISKKKIRANSWNGYPVSWLHGKTVTGHSILYDSEAKIVIWRESQTRHGWADVKGEEGKQYFIAPDSGVEIIIGDFELIPPEMPASGGQEWLPGFYYGGISST